MIRNILFIFITLIYSRDLSVEFISENPWLTGHSWVGGTTFYNSISSGLSIFGNSSVDPDNPINVDIYFSENPDSISNAMVFSAESFGQQIGVGIFPGSAWDTTDPENPRRLNICFFERNNDNLLWDPTSVNGMDMEYLLIMTSDYDFTGMTYDNADITILDVQYFCWLKKTIGEEWFSSEPAELIFTNSWSFSEFYLESNIDYVTIHFEHESPIAEQQEINYYIIKKRLYGQDIWEEEVELEVGLNQYVWTGLETNQFYEFQVIGFDFSDEVLMESEIHSIEPRQILYNTELVGTNNTANEVLIGASTYNDIWGYTSSDGKEYALIGAWDGTQIIDISTDPQNPVTVGYISGSYSTHRDIKTYGNYMYIGTEANRNDPYLMEETGEYYVIPQGIQVVNLSDPENAELVYEWDGVVQSHNIMEYQGYLYIIGSNQAESNDGTISWGLDDLIILDLHSEPSIPVKVGGWSGEYIHDVCLYENILYASAIYSDQVYAFDISDKSNPFIITQWGGVPNSHACWVSDDGNTLFTASETSSGHILSWDVSNLNNVNFLDEWFPEDGEDWSVHNIFYKNGYIFASHYAWGLQIINVEDSSNMYTAGYYDTFNFSPVGLYDGAWGTFPYFSSDKIIISDRSTGLHIVDFTLDDWSDPDIEGDVNNDNVLNILDIMILVNYIVSGTELEEYQYDVANINNDDVIDILDIIIMINIILNDG